MNEDELETAEKDDESGVVKEAMLSVACVIAAGVGYIVGRNIILSLVGVDHE